MSSTLLELGFSHDNPCSTIITNSTTGDIVYRVETDFGKETITRVTNSRGEMIASWVWKNLKSDVLTFGKQLPAPMSKWLKKSFFKDITTVEDEKGEKYRWKPIGNGSGSQLQLFAEYDEINPIASFQKSRTIGNRPGPVTPPASAVQPARQAARLVLSQRGVDIQDIAVISFLVIEKNRRVKQARATADKEDIRMRYRTPWDSPNTATTGDLVNIAGPAF